MKKNRTHSGDFKARVAMEALKGLKTLAEISSEYEVNSTLICKWKKQLQQNLPDLFSKPLNRVNESEKEKEELFKEIGKLKVENEFLKKKYKQIYG